MHLINEKNIYDYNGNFAKDSNEWISIDSFLYSENNF